MTIQHARRLVRLIMALRARGVLSAYSAERHLAYLFRRVPVV